MESRETYIFQITSRKIVKSWVFHLFTKTKLDFFAMDLTAGTKWLFRYVFPLLHLGINYNRQFKIVSNEPSQRFSSFAKFEIYMLEFDIGTLLKRRLIYNG